MAIPKSLCDRELDRFKESSSTPGQTAVVVVNPDGSDISGGGGGGTGPLPPGSTSTINSFGTVAAVATSTTTDIVSYTVPVGKTFYLSHVEYSGENVADFEVLEDAAVIAKKRTYFGGDLAGDFPFERTRFSAGTVVKLRVTHARPLSADFEGRINGWEV